MPQTHSPIHTHNHTYLHLSDRLVRFLANSILCSARVDWWRKDSLLLHPPPHHTLLSTSISYCPKTRLNISPADQCQPTLFGWRSPTLPLICSRYYCLSFGHEWLLHLVPCFKVHCLLYCPYFLRFLVLVESPGDWSNGLAFTFTYIPVEIGTPKLSHVSYCSSGYN